MIDIAALFDSYSRQARLYPALLVILPPVLLVIAWIPALLDVGEVVVAILVACGLLFFLADFARTRGKKLEPALLHEWGGWPTTIWLRHSDSHLFEETKRRYHAFLSRQPSIGPLPTADEEKANPRESDRRYTSSVMWLKEQCRGKAFPLVEKENATYGFRRNVTGLKPIGIVVCILTALGPAVVTAANSGFDRSHFFYSLARAYLNAPGAVLGVTGFSLIAFISWLFVVRRSWVREAGDQYARALLAGCDTLDRGVAGV